MVRKALQWCVCVLVLVCAFPRPASAIEWDFFEWLERLSGPGPFTSKAGLNFTWTPICYGIKADDAEEALTKTDNGYELFVDVTCGRAARPRLSARFGISYSRLEGRNNLQYVTLVPLSEEDREIDLTAFMFVGDLSLRPFLDVGAGVGFLRFSGAPFDSFSRFALEPTRVTFRPLAIGDRIRLPWRDVLELRHTTVYVPGGFDDRDFNAVLGSFETDLEFQSQFAIVVNVGAFFDAFKTCRRRGTC